MMPDCLIANALVLDPDGLRGAQDVWVQRGKITHPAPGGSMSDGVMVHDCTGLLLVPAYTNVHHHFSTGLLRGSPAPQNPTRNQRERLERVIWPFERRLTREDIRVAVRAGLLEAVAAGTTTVIDHHASRNCIPGILDVIAEEVQAAGLRAILCYEVTDRDGEKVAASGLAETERFLSNIRDERDTLRGMVGLHALSTVGHKTLARAVSVSQEFGVGLHLHLGEAVHDNIDSVERYGGRPLARLEAAAGLTPSTLAAHAVHVTDEEIALLGARDVLIANNPRSNASNGVGVANVLALRSAGCVVGIGGDGFTQDIRAEMSLLPLQQRQEFRDPIILPPRSLIDFAIQGNSQILERLGGWRTGRIAAGLAADLVALDYNPLVPLVPENALWHYAGGFPGASVREVWVGGHHVLRNGEFTTLDAEKIRLEVGERFQAFWTPSEA
jgi:cytosine/adenosine deaminase-related metal-dependent hydrolase